MRRIRQNRENYLVYFLVMILLALSGMHYRFNATLTGFFIALVFCHERALILAIMYVLTSLIVSPTLETFAVALVPAVVMTITRLIVDKLRIQMTFLITGVSTLLSLIPVIVMAVLDRSYIIYGIVTIIVTAIFTYLSIVGLFAVVVKRLRYRLSMDESVSLLSILIVMSMGLMNINVFGFRIYYLIMVLLVLSLTSICEITPSIIVMSAYGIGGGIMSANLELAGIILIMTLLSSLFMRYNRYFSLVSVLAVDMVGGAYFGAFETYTYLHLIAVLLGGIIFLVIPPRYLRATRRLYSRDTRSSAEISYINRNRIDVSTKITNLASIFSNIEAEMTGNEYVMSEKGAEKHISERIMSETCLDCPNRAKCFKALGGDTLSEIEPIVARARLSHASIDDVSMFLTSRCMKRGDIVNLANTYAEKYAKIGIHICNVLDNKRILGEQIGGIGRVLSTLSSSVGQGVNQDSDMERLIIEELNVSGVICNDVLVLERRGTGAEITLVVRSVDKAKRIIRDTLERLLRLDLTLREDKLSEIDGFSVLVFVPRPQYRLTYGIGSAKMEGSDASGDSRSIVRLDESHIAIVLCDGKGSGTHAEENSTHTIGIIENMYRAGLSSDMILSFANSILSIRNSEDFSALDMCIINLQNASLDFIKLGGVTSFIRRTNSVDTIEGSALPLGVLDEAVPSIERRAVSVGDIVLLVSDGVTDSIGEAGVSDILMSYDGFNVQRVADEIVMRASSHGAIDDISVIAFGITKNR